MRQLPALMIVIAGCAAVPAQERLARTWEGQCYRNLVRDVAELAGSDAVDCGFLPVNASAAQRSATDTCARNAVGTAQAFKTGYASFGDDSDYCDVAIRRTDGQLISFYFDADVTGQMGSGGGNSVVWTSRCKSIAFRPGTIGAGSFFDLQDCTEAPELFSGLTSQKD